MRLAGLHHITMITGDAQANVDFYADLLGLRLVKKTVNFDQPDAYHLYFGDEAGTPGSLLTWFEFVGARRGRAGAGMVHTIELGVASDAALDFWADRLAAKGHESTPADGALRLADPDGLGLVQRNACADDGRGSYAELRPAGLERLQAARRTHLLGVRRFFLDRLTREDQQALADAWGRVLPAE